MATGTVRGTTIDALLDPPWLLPLITLTVAFAAFAKGATGLGFPLISVPVLASFVGVEPAVVVIALPNLVLNTVLLWEHRSEARRTRAVVPMVAAGAVGVVLGTLSLRGAPERLLAGVLGLLIALYLAAGVARPDLRLSERAIRRSAPAVGAVGGFLQGIAGFSGPLIGTYVHAWRLPREAYVFVVSAAFQASSMVQVATMASTGMLSASRLVQGAYALLPSMGGLVLGIVAARRLPQRRFELLIRSFMAVLCARLLWTAVAG